MAKTKAETFIERTKKNVNKQVPSIINNTLVSMWENNVKVWDQSYIEKRTRLILEEIVKNIDFQSDKIKRLRMEIFNDALSKLKNMKVLLPKDKEPLNASRDKKCEPVCLDIIQELLDEDMLNLDKEWFSDALTQDDELLLTNRIKPFTDALFDGLDLSLNTSMLRASTKLWGCEREDITMKQVDGILKSK